MHKIKIELERESTQYNYTTRRNERESLDREVCTRRKRVQLTNKYEENKIR